MLTFFLGGHEGLTCFAFPVVFLVLLVVLARAPGGSRRRRRFEGLPTPPLTCPRCSTVNRPIARYCANCGLRLR